MGEDILPPVAPQTAPKADAKSGAKADAKSRLGFLKRMFVKEEEQPADELAALRERLGISGERPPSLQRSFEEQVSVDAAASLPDAVPQPVAPLEDAVDVPLPADDESAPLPPEVLKDDAPVDAPVAQALIEPAKVEKPGGEDLLERLSEIKKRDKGPQAVELTFKDKPVSTVSEFHDMLKRMTNAKVSEGLRSGRFAQWARTSLFDDALADDILKVGDKRELVELISQELGLPKKHPSQKRSASSHVSVEEHFDKLHDDHKKSMAQLERIVKSRSVHDLSKQNLKKYLRTENNKLVESIYDLVHALEIVDDQTYHDALVEDKDAFREWIKGLAKKASHAGNLDAEKLQDALAEMIHRESSRIEEVIRDQQERLTEQAKMLVEQEDTLVKNRESLAVEEERVRAQQLIMADRKEGFRKEIAAEKEKLSAERAEIEALVKDVDERLSDFDERVKRQKEEDERVRAALHEHDVELRQREIEIPLKHKVREEKISRRERELDDRENRVVEKEEALAAREEVFEQRFARLDKQMRKREDLVQSSVDKLLSVDADIRSQASEVKELKDDIDSGSFRKYLEAQLKDIHADHPIVEDVAPMDDLREAHDDLFSRIDAVNGAIEAKDFSEAKRRYNELKEAFEKEHFSQEERDILYDAIRELYASLHLALLEK